MIKEIKMYTAICDVCGADSNSGQEVSAWGDKNDAIYVAGECGFVFNGDYCKCEDCTLATQN